MRIGVAGLGLIGGSLAAALSAAGHEVIGFDTRSESNRLAEKRGWAKPTNSLDDLVFQSEVVMLCMPVGATLEAIGPAAARMAPSSILTDVASVKRPVLTRMDEIDGGPRCIGGHPMAGKAQGGIESADADLFRGAPYALVPAGNCDEDAVATMRQIVVDIGANPVMTDAESHDREVAAGSHLPQVLSSALSLALSGGQELSLKGPGLAGMLRLARSDEDLWTEILTFNADNVLVELARFQTQTDGIASALGSSGGPELLSLLREAREAVS
jgi:prephenate dehydrogenase